MKHLRRLFPLAIGLIAATCSISASKAEKNNDIVLLAHVLFGSMLGPAIAGIRM
jgi:hypothetical protein